MLCRVKYAILTASIFFAIVGASSSMSFFQRTGFEFVAPGVRYYHFLEPTAPANLDVIRILRKERFTSLMPMMGKGTLKGVEPVSKMVGKLNIRGYYPVAAVNGDFYHLGTWDGMTLGLMMADREILTSPPLKKNGSLRPSFVIYTSGKPDIAEVGYRGKIVVPGTPHYELFGVNRPRKWGGFILYTPKFGAATPYEEGAVDLVLGNVTGIQKASRWKLVAGRKYRATVTSIKSGGGAKIPKGGAVLGIVGSSSVYRDLKPGSKIWFRFDRVGGKGTIKSAISGKPMVVERGRNLHGPGKGARHPRTAIGYNDDEILLAVVDGRRAGWSRGMSLHELGELMLRMKCTEAINLDGGGSSTMWVRGDLKNKVSDGKERSVSNGLAVVSSAPRTQRLQKLTVEPAELSVLTGHVVRMYASGKDKYYNPVPIGGKPDWSADRAVGKISPDGTFTSGSRSAHGRIAVGFGHLREYVKVNVYETPPIFQILPTSANFLIGENKMFNYVAMDHGTLPVLGDYAGRLRWSVTPGLGRIDSAGMFTAGNVTAKGEITLSLGNIVRKAPITVGTRPKLLDGFEKFSVWNFSSFPDNKLPGYFKISAAGAYRGKRGVELSYKFDDRFELEAAYGRTSINLGRPMAVMIYVKGNGSTHELRMAYRNKYDGRKTVSFTEGTLSSTSWHKATARIPPDEYFPVKFESIYVLKDKEATSRMSGKIYLDEITGLYPPQ